MKVRFELPEIASTFAMQRGAALIGLLQELPSIELAAIVYLRAWCKGGADREMIGRDFTFVCGEREGKKAAGDWDALMELFLSGARRPVMRHGLDCQCFGGDESAFANMIAAAASQDREDALLFASTLMTGDAAWAAVQVALPLGQVFLRLARTAGRTASEIQQITYRH